MKVQDLRADALWLGHNDLNRINIALFDLVESENFRAREILKAQETGDSQKEKELRETLIRALPILNETLEAANLAIAISINKRQQFLASKDGSDRYSIAQLSDGEKSALLIGARVLTVDPGTLLLIDEPERHLHRSIAAPLLLSLFARRKDCSFVVSTHEVSLPMDSPESKTVLLRSCVWGEERVVAWDADILKEGELPDGRVRRAILGARRKIVFVEGDSNSLDERIYSVLYPGLSIIPSGDCRDVERAVRGSRGAEALNWLRAYGLVDRDDRAADEVEKLEQQHVFALEGYSVESLYYCLPVRQKIAERQAKVLPETPDLATVHQSILDAVRPHRQRLCEGIVMRRARNALVRMSVHEFQFEWAALLADEFATFDELLKANDGGDGLIDRYPVRTTPTLDKVAKGLGFPSRASYQGAVIKLLREDTDARKTLLDKLRGLTDAVIRDS